MRLCPILILPGFKSIKRFVCHAEISIIPDNFNEKNINKTIYGGEFDINWIKI